jgi:uncharacterized spore protein YtfJ
MEIKDLLAQARDAMTVKRVFGDPIEKDGVTVVPVAKVAGGAGGGSGTSGEGETSSGSGGGFGLRAVPAGVYVIRGAEVSWQPALDVNRVIFGGQLVAIVLLLTIRAIVKARAGNQS